MDQHGQIYITALLVAESLMKWTNNLMNAKSLYTTFEKFWAAKKQTRNKSHAHQSYIYLNHKYCENSTYYEIFQFKITVLF